MKTKSSIFSSILLCTLFVVEAQAGTLDDIGFTDLSLELGAALPDGGSITVTQVEAPVSDTCAPDMTRDEFSNITFNDNTQSVCTSGASGHATSVATKFYGAVTSSSTAIGTVDLFEAVDWLFTGFLNPNGGDPISASIGTSTTRIANHSWGGSSTGSGVFLRRIDFLVEVDEFIQVVGVHPDITTNELPSNSFNAIVAGLSAGAGVTGTKAVDTTYVSGRAKPDIVAPESTGSASAPRVSSAAVLLMDYAHTNSLLSNGSTTNRNSDIIYNAERSETVKALLMAGADRETSGNTNAIDITDYRAAGKQTSNGLDTRFGAGQLNIYNSYHILAAGEQDNAEDGGSTFANAGFDYDPSFGGLSGNSTATYSFTTSAIGGQKLKAALVWNLDVLTTSTDNFYDLDLQLFDVTGGAEVVISNSVIDNTENLWLDLLSNRSYELRVIKGAGQLDFDWDYALAWQIVVPGVIVVETDSLTVTAEDGTTDTFTLVLDSPPTDDVVIVLTSSNTDEATVSPASVTFTSSNWSTLQTITVTGVNDAVDDGDIYYDINFTVSSTADANYDGLALASISASNLDDDVTPSVDAGQSFTIDENSAVSTLVGNVTAIAPTSTITSYTIFSGDAGGIFAIDDVGDLTVVGVIDYETATSYTLGIKVSDGVNESISEDVVVTVNDFNDTAPVITSSQTLNVDENSINGASVGTVNASDVDSVVTDFTIVGGSAIFVIDSNGLITVSGAINYESITGYTLSITAADDSANTSSAVDVVVNVNNLDEIPPTVTSSQSFDIDENSVNATVVGAVIAIDDEDAGGAVSGFTIVSGNVGNVFTIASSGEITVAGSIDFETTSSYTLGITATDDSANISSAVNIDIAVNDINESSGGGGSGSLHLMWLALPLFITVCRRRVLH